MGDRYKSLEQNRTWSSRYTGMVGELAPTGDGRIRCCPARAKAVLRRLHSINISLHALPLCLARGKEVSDSALVAIVSSNVPVCSIWVPHGRLGERTRSWTARCLSNSSRANFLVSTRVFGSPMRRVLRRTVRYRDRTRFRRMNCPETESVQEYILRRLYIRT